MKIPRAQDAGLLPVELAQPREQHRPDGHVHAHSQRVRAANDLEQALLRELLNEHAILRQQPRVVNPDPMLQPLADFQSVGTGELEARSRRLVSRAQQRKRRLQSSTRGALTDFSHLERRRLDPRQPRKPVRPLQ